MNMRTLVLFFTLLTFKLTAQVNLKFDKLFVECEDKWVAFKMAEDRSEEHTSELQSL